MYVFLIFLLLLELSLNLYFFTERHQWIFKTIEHPNGRLFEKHPYLVAANRKNIETEFNGFQVFHNRFGMRSSEFSDENLKNSVKIAAIGGSTTYGVGVDNSDTWPAFLGGLTGPDTLVLNLSVPGHSTVENLITAGLYLDDFKPDIILLHVGLNDLRSSNVNELLNDYSNFHEPHLYGSMGLCYLESLPKIATVFYTVRLMQKYGMYPVCDFHRAVVKGKIAGLDLYALSIYRQNLKKLIHMCKYYTNRIIIVPQILVEEKIEGDGLLWWIPFVKTEKLIEVLQSYNYTSREVSDSAGLSYVYGVEEWPWKADDFADPSHLNKSGNKKLAELIFEEIKRENKISPVLTTLPVTD